MVARKLSSYDVTSPESFSKRPSVYIDPDSDIFEGLQYLHNIKRQNCINCLQLWSKSSLEGIFECYDEEGVSHSLVFCKEQSGIWMFGQKFQKIIWNYLKCGINLVFLIEFVIGKSQSRTNLEYGTFTINSLQSWIHSNQTLYEILGKIPYSRSVSRSISP